MPVYLDCNATTPVETEVLDAVVDYMRNEYGNEGSFTHEFGTVAREKVQLARLRVGEVVGAKPEEVTFTSGATESNNIAIFGLARFGERRRRKHIITTAMEHRAVLGPLSVLEQQGFRTTYLKPDARGRISVQEFRAALCEETLLVSIMHVNNETGVVQPLDEIAAAMQDHQAFLHTDSAQGFGKELEMLRLPRIDMISVSGHKVYAPQGIGALIVRKRGALPPPLEPIMYGGGQQKGLRPGTLPVQLIVGLGTAAHLALRDHDRRMAYCRAFKKEALEALAPLHPIVHGDPELALATTLFVSFPGIDSKRVIEVTKELIAVSNGSACTSSTFMPSRVLQAMKVPEEVIVGAIRISWCHLTPRVDWHEVARRIAAAGR